MDLLEAIIGLGPNVFYGTQLAPCIMVFKQEKAENKAHPTYRCDGPSNPGNISCRPYTKRHF